MLYTVGPTIQFGFISTTVHSRETPHSADEQVRNVKRSVNIKHGEKPEKVMNCKTE